jgi:hypothetical protein
MAHDAGSGAAEEGGDDNGVVAAEGSPHAGVEQDSPELGHEDDGDGAPETEADEHAEEPAANVDDAGQAGSINDGEGIAEDGQHSLDIGGNEDDVAVDASAQANDDTHAVDGIDADRPTSEGEAGVGVPLDRTMDRTMTPQFYTEFSHTTGDRDTSGRVTELRPLGSTANLQVVGEDDDRVDGGSDRQRTATALSVDVGDMSYDAAEREVIVQMHNVFLVPQNFVLATNISLQINCSPLLHCICD